MSNDGIRWVEGAVVGLTILAVGCNEPEPGEDNADETDGTTGNDPTDTGEVPDNGIPLELKLALFNKTGKFLLLRFSEPMAPADTVDPSDFRVSVATTWRYTNYGNSYANSNYRDPLYYLGYGYYYYEPSKLLEFDLVTNGKQATDIVLRLVEPMTAENCSKYAQAQANFADLDAQPEYEAKIGLFPHYSPGAVKLQSLDGEVLQAIGADWVEYAAPSMQLYSDFGWANLNPQIEIPCTVEPQP